MADSSACSLCDEFAQGVRGSILREFWTEDDVHGRIIDESDSFVAIPSVGQLVEGHVLICTRGHSLSMGRWIAHAHDPTELVAFVTRVRSNLESLYGSKTVIFEHGPSAAGGTLGCGTDHAHLHIVPLEIDLRKNVSAKSLAWTRCDSLEALGEYADRGLGYVFFQDSGNDAYVSIVERPVPTQLFRRIVTAELGQRDKWDWRRYPRSELIQEVMSKYSAT